MSLWGQKKSGIKPAPRQVRIERVPVAKKPPPIPSRLSSQKLTQVRQSQNTPDRSQNSSARSSPGTPTGNGDRNSRLQPRKRKATRQNSPSQVPLKDDSDDDGTPTDFDGFNKRQKTGRLVDANRRFRAEQVPSAPGGQPFRFIHAADLLSAETIPKLAKGAVVNEDIVSVELKYPTSSPHERYNLIFLPEQLNPAHEIEGVATHIANVYLKPDQKMAFTEPNTGIIRQITKAKNKLLQNNKTQVDEKLLLAFKAAVDRYNLKVEEFSLDGPLERNLDSIDHLPLEMVECILRQNYGRTVSPKVDILKKRKDQEDKNNTYGELEAVFVSEALAKAGLKSDQLFVDLGSGVGNVVLQAALEFGCDSFGCEMVDNACDLAEAQEKEFAVRCRLWGLRTGNTQLERGSFFDNQATYAAIKKADVILVNNEVFSPDVNDKLIAMFLDCKDGCKIVSLQPFVEPGREITEHNRHNPVNQLVVKRHQYYNGYVSWKHDGGDYYISTKNSKRMETF